MITDPIADMLTRVRNAMMVRHDSVLMPSSKVKIAIAKILKEQGFVSDYEVVKGKPQRMLKIHLRYDENGQSMLSGLERVSRPGLKVYVQRKEVPRVYGGLGIAIISTSKGIITGQQARRQGIGGEVLCHVW